MSFIDLFWIFFMLATTLAMLQPVLRKRMLEAKRWRRIGQLERRRGSRVVLLVHRQETMQLLGFPLVRYIDIHDSEKVLRAIHTTDPNVPLDIILHTPGGLVLAAIQIARAFCDHKAQVTVFVPHYAMSGGTLIALAADEIVMSKHAVRYESLDEKNDPLVAIAALAILNLRGSTAHKRKQPLLRRCGWKLSDLWIDRTEHTCARKILNASPKAFRKYAENTLKLLS